MDSKVTIQILITGLVLLGLVGVFALQEVNGDEPVGAPSTQLRLERTIIPETDSIYDLGTSTRAWRDGYFDQLCLTADTCQTSWPAGGGGSFGQAWEIDANNYLAPTTSPNTVRTPDGLISQSSSTFIGITTIDDVLQFNGSTSVPHTEGVFYYDTTNFAFEAYNAEAEVELLVGETVWYRARNNSGSTITQLSPVYITGATGNRPNIALARANADGGGGDVVLAGVATHDIENNSDGYIMTKGIIKNVDTSAWGAGEELFLGTTTAGTLITFSTNGLPQGPDWAVPVGFVLTSNPSTGSILVDRHAWYETTDLTSENREQTITADWVFDNATTTFTQASSTQFSAGLAYFGETATSTFNTAGLGTFQGFISNASSTILGDFTVTGNSTTTGFLEVNGSGTSTFTGGIQANVLDIQSTSATSTFGNGIRIEGGSLQIEQLASCTGDIETDANGIFACGADDVGGGSLTWGQQWEIIPQGGGNFLSPTTTTLSLYVGPTQEGDAHINTNNGLLNVFGTSTDSTLIVASTTDGHTGDILRFASSTNGHLLSISASGDLYGSSTAAFSGQLYIKADDNDKVMRFEERTGSEFIDLELDSSGDLVFVNDADQITFRVADQFQRVYATRIFGEGDTDTSIVFSDDKIAYTAGALEMMTMTEAATDEFIINDTANDIDWRVEAWGSEGDANDYDEAGFFFNGQVGNVGIGTTTDASSWDARLHLQGDGLYDFFKISRGEGSSNGRIDQPIFLVDLTENIGIATDTPYLPLSVVGEGGIVMEQFHATGTASSTIDAGLTVDVLDIQSTSASSTFGNGLVIENGSLQLLQTLDCNGTSVLETDVNGNIQCGTDDDTGGAGASIGQAWDLYDTVLPSYLAPTSTIDVLEAQSVFIGTSTTALALEGANAQLALFATSTTGNIILASTTPGQVGDIFRAVDSTGSDMLKITSGGNILASSSSFVISEPSFAFENDPDTGFTTEALNSFSFVSGGSVVARFLSSSLQIMLDNDLVSDTTNGFFAINNGTGESNTASTPTYSFTTDLDTGMFRTGDNDVGLSAGGTELLSIINDTDPLEVVVNDTSANVDFRVESDLNTHHFFLQGSDGFIGVATDTPYLPLSVVGAGGLVVEQFHATGTDAEGHNQFDAHISASSTLSVGDVLTLNGNIVPQTTDGVSLGTSALNFSDLFLDSGGVINFNSSDVTITHGSNVLDFSGASSGYRFANLVIPSSDGSAPLGSLGSGWNGAVLITGSALEWNNGAGASDLTLTHSTGLLTLSASDGFTMSGAFINSDGSLEIPNGTNPTIDAVGELGFDTQGNDVNEAQLLIGTSTATVIARTPDLIWSFRQASTSIPIWDGFTSGDIIGLPPERDGYTIYTIECAVWGGTSIVVSLRDAAGNQTNTGTCNASATTTLEVKTNNTFTAQEGVEVVIGTVTGTPDDLFISMFGVWTRE